MTVTAITGPLITTGNITPTQRTESDAAPILASDAYGWLDPRYVSSIGDAPGFSAAGIGVYMAPNLCSVDSFPIAKATNNIVAAQGAGQTAGFVLPLATGTVQSAVSAVPIVPFVASTDVYGNRNLIPQGYISSNVVTTGLALDYGFCAATTFTSATVTLTTNTGPTVGVYPQAYSGVTVNKNQILQLVTTNHVQPELMFSPGMPIIVANAGNAGGTIPLITSVLAVDYVNHYVYMANPALAAVTNAGVGSANQFGLNVAIAAWPYNVHGSLALFDPRQGTCRSLQYVSTNAGDTTVTVTVRGYDVYSAPMTETITLNGTTIVNGKKAFKYIQSATTGVASLVGNVNIGTTDTMGFNFRTDAMSYAMTYVADALITAATGFTKADVTPVATATTGDVRGTYTLQTASNGTNRFLQLLSPSPFQFDIEYNLVQQPLFGQAQF